MYIIREVWDFSTVFAPQLPIITVYRPQIVRDRWLYNAISIFSLRELLGKGEFILKQEEK